MPSQRMLRKYAKLAVSVGANVRKNQPLLISASVETKDFVRIMVEEAYKAGASGVTVRWLDQQVSHTSFKYATTENLCEVPDFVVSQMKYYIDKGFATISVSADTPGLMADIDPIKLQKVGMANGKALKFFSDHMMGNRTQWCVVSVPTEGWAKKVFPNERASKAVDKLWDAIFAAVRVTKDNDPVKEWKAHNEILHKHNEMLNNYNFKALKFKNGLGTDLTVGLVKNHVWAGGNEKSTKGIVFNPNMPTEESFSMPEKKGVNGKVVATKPLNYNGSLIEDFWLTFKDGKVVDFDARTSKEALTSLVNYDDGSCYLGEVALISHDSPISNANILFFNTLFDENASCHLALGRAYPMNVKGGNSMNQEQLDAAGANNSMTHNDFMFGSADMSVIGITQEDKEVIVFKNGNFVF